MPRLTCLLVAAMAAAFPVHAQRPAVSAQLSPEQAGAAFAQAVSDICVPAVSGNGVSALAAAREGRISPTQDVDARRQAGANPDETVWELTDVRGVVTVRERAGRCVVSVYGPASAPTVIGAMQLLTGRGFEAMVGQGSGSIQTLLGESGGRRVSVQLSGAEPGSPGHQSRFTVVTATVVAIQ